MPARRYFVYILLPNRPKGVLYVGTTGDLVRRIGEHKNRYTRGFTTEYALNRLLYFEEYASILEARQRERTVKRWHRAWKISLIEKMSPKLADLSDQLAL
jgi:putative endonuclease